jgi:heme/copper-type cytochrome/quinol oxidase subunit 1
MLSTVGAAIIAVSALVFTINILRSLRQGDVAGYNPWGASTLEWSIPSPPPHYNFAVIPTVRSLHPLWDEEANAIEAPALPLHEEPNMPSPSYWPIVIAFAIAMIAGGLIIWQAHVIAGLTVMASMGLLGMRGVYGWILEPLEEEAAVPVHH